MKGDQCNLLGRFAAQIISRIYIMAEEKSFIKIFFIDEKTV